MKTKFDVSFWRDPEGNIFAFPLDAKDPFGGEIVPMLDDKGWAFLGTLPKGQPASDVKPLDEGNKVRCKIAGKAVFTGDWVLE